MLNILDENVAQVKAEMPRQIARWGQPASLQAWDNNVATLRQIVSQRRAQMIASLQQSFNLSDATMKQLFPKDLK
jgi:recombinational DNA repair ATPase RecF